MGETGEALIQISADGYAILTVRQPQAERLAEIRLTIIQAQALADLLGRVPEAPEEEEFA